MPLVVITGARQAGKSTLARATPALADRRYLTLDDPELRDQTRREPASLPARGPELVPDEVQRAPALLLAVKRPVDEDRPRRPGRYVLTDSTNLLRMERISESLASRAVYIRLWPLTRAERLGLGTTGTWGELLEASVREWEGLVRAQDVPPEDWPPWPPWAASRCPRTSLRRRRSARSGSTATWTRTSSAMLCPPIRGTLKERR